MIQFERRQREKKAKEEEDKKKKEAEFEEEMRRRLARQGYTQSQIDVMVKEKEEKKPATTTTTTTTIEKFRSSAPVYAKVHRDYLSVDTLRYYEIPYEYDRVRANPPPHLVALMLTVCVMPERPELHNHPARNGQVRDGGAVRAHAAPAGGEAVVGCPRQG